MSRILIVDDEASICWAFREFLTDEGHEVDVASSAEDGLALLDSRTVDAVVLDVRLPGVDGLTAMQRFRDRLGSRPIVVMTAFGNLETAIRAMEGGAFDYLVKPFDLDQAGAVLRRALEPGPPGRMPKEAGPDEALIGSSPAMQELFKSIALVAPTDVPVLITGESGTGKELVARAIHRHSGRRDRPFLPVCLAALAPSLIERELFGHLKGSFTGAGQDRQGLLELAYGGTVLLDEVGDIPPAVQVKLLRSIEHREVTPVGDARPRRTDFRVIAATNQPLEELVHSSRFREDLFFRLSVFRIHLPPLRDRRDDIPALAAHFLEQAWGSAEAGSSMTPEALEELRSRPWPGNVRELRNAIERAAILARGRAIRPEHLPPVMGPRQDPERSVGGSLQVQLARWASQALCQSGNKEGEGSLYERLLDLAEPPLLRAALQQCGQNRAAAAQLLGIHRATLRQKLRKHGIA